MPKHTANTDLRPAGIALALSAVAFVFAVQIGVSSVRGTWTAQTSGTSTGSLASSHSFSTASNVCGNGILEGSEQCEPAGTTGCSVNCKRTAVSSSKSSIRSSTSNKSSVPPANCGNGMLEPEKGEDCDNGRYNGNSPDCSLFCKSKYCGDGVISPENNEECEPGNLRQPACGARVCAEPDCDEKGTCAGGCRWTFLPACPASQAAAQAVSSQSSVMTASGGALNGSGLLLTSSRSSSVGSFASSSRSSLSSSRSAVFSSSAATPTGPSCGDGSVQLNEQCEPPNTAYCTAFCLFTPLDPPNCGDGKVQMGEECDAGKANSDKMPDACRIGCRKARCGDGIKDASEECDDGNTLFGDACTPACVRGACGNGILEPGEECDDGFFNEDQKPDSCSTRCRMPRCGNGIVDPSYAEDCDDGNVVSGDGCDVRCMVERSPIVSISSSSAAVVASGSALSMASMSSVATGSGAIMGEGSSLLSSPMLILAAVPFLGLPLPVLLYLLRKAKKRKGKIG